MKKGKLGFTIIEVAIFLAVTGLLFLVVTIGVQSSIYQQRRNDSIQGFMEFLRTTYSEVTNVQNVVEGGGQSENAIYGRLIVFGEDRDFSGELNNDNQIFVYTVVGEIPGERKESIETKTLELLDSLNAGVKISDGWAGFPGNYTPRWSAEIQPACKDEDSCFEPLKGMVLIVRHPSSGTINTYFSGKVVQINYDESLSFTGSEFSIETIDFCVNTSGKQEATGRADVRIFEGARSASAIELIPEDESACQ